MSKKRNSGGIVFSTDPDFRQQEDGPEITETLPPARQKLRVHLDSKQRAGKSVTLITAFIGKEEGLEDLGKKLKTFCGTGGSVKDGEIIIQGDNRDKVLGWLLKNGFTGSKKI